MVRPCLRVSSKRGQAGGPDAVASLAIRVVADRPIVGRIGRGQVRFVGPTVLVLVVPEVRRVLLMRADARSRSPTPLEGQQAHHEDEDETTHERSSLSVDAWSLFLLHRSGCPLFKQ